MWKKNDVPDSSKRPPEPQQPIAPAPPVKSAHVGGTLTIKGDLYGEEDLFIEGRIEGKNHRQEGQCDGR